MKSIVWGFRVIFRGFWIFNWCLEVVIVDNLVRLSLAFGGRILIVSVSKWWSTCCTTVMFMYKTSADICIINKECLEEYGSYFKGTDSIMVLFWTGSYLKIDGSWEQVLIYEDMTRFLLLIYSYELEFVVVFCLFAVKECLDEESSREYLLIGSGEKGYVEFKEMVDFVACFCFKKGHVFFGFFSWLLLVSLCIGTYQLVSLLCMFPKHVLGMSVLMHIRVIRIVLVL